VKFSFQLSAKYRKHRSNMAKLVEKASKSVSFAGDCKQWGKILDKKN